MRAENKKTGEIVNITSYFERNSKYYIHGVNSRGVEFGGEGDNFNEDFEFIEEKLKHWQDVKERAAIAVRQGLSANPALVEEDDYDLALTAKCRVVQFVERLKKGIIMTREEKVDELSDKYDTIAECNAAYDAALEAMEWAFNKAYKWLEEHANEYNGSESAYDHLEEQLIDDFREAMKE